MTVPTQRGPSDEQGSVLGFFADSVRDLKDTVNTGFRDLHASIDKLRDETVHRREFDRYRDERALELAAAKQQHDRDITEIREEAEKRATQAAGLRKWLIGLGVSAAVGIGGDVIAAIALHH